MSDGTLNLQTLIAGIPTLIKPWFGDQFFWAARVQKLGAGLRVQSLSSSDLASALTKATSDRSVVLDLVLSHRSLSC